MIGGPRTTHHDAQKDRCVDEGVELSTQDHSTEDFGIPGQPAIKQSYLTSTNGLLSPPSSETVRPISPDTLSQLSADEYVQLAPARLSSSSVAIDEREITHKGWRGSLQASWRRNRGVVYMLLAQLFGCAMNVTTRLLEIGGNKGQGFHPFQVLFARMGITFVLATGYMYWAKTPHFPFGLPQVRWLLIARGFGGFFGVFGMYYSLLYLPLADATVLTFLAPGIACWACSFFIDEPFTRREQWAGLVSLVGVVLIARPTSFFTSGAPSDLTSAGESDTIATGANSTAMTGSHDVGDLASLDKVTPSQRLFAVAISMVGVLGSATAFTTIRWIGKRAHPLVSVNYFAAWCFLVSIVMQSVLPGVGFLLPADVREWGYLIFLGICGFIMQYLMAAGLAHEKSSRATNMAYTQMLFALAFDKMIFGHTPGWLSIAGSSLILGSATVVAMQQSMQQGKADAQSSRRNADQESQRGLMSGLPADVGQESVISPVQEVQMRTLR